MVTAATAEPFLEWARQLGAEIGPVAVAKSTGQTQPICSSSACLHCQSTAASERAGLFAADAIAAGSAILTLPAKLLFRWPLCSNMLVDRMRCAALARFARLLALSFRLICCQTSKLSSRCSCCIKCLQRVSLQSYSLLSWNSCSDAATEAKWAPFIDSLPANPRSVCFFSKVNRL